MRIALEVSSLEYDIIIRNALVIDGTGQPARRASIAIVNGRIAEIGDVRGDAKRIIEASGLIATPGFIDIHAHGDLTILQYPLAENYVLQGVTTIVGGNCGFSPAPIKNVWLMSFWEFDWWHEIAPYKYDPDVIQPIEKVNEKLKEKYGWSIDWRSFSEFLSRVEQTGISVNYIPLIGHNTVRAAVMEKDFKRKARPEEIEEMRKLVAEAMEAGAFGMSTGLDYIPGAYADTSEIVELVKVVKEYGGLYFTHWRSGYRTGDWSRDRVKGLIEAIEIAKKTGVSLQISHIYSVYTVQPLPPKVLQEAQAKATLEVIEKARSEGVDVTFDVIPNVDGGLFIIPRLVSYLTPWLIELGSIEALIRNLKIKEFRDEVKEAIRAGKFRYLNPKVDPLWMDKMRILAHKNESYVGKTIGEIAKSRNEDPLDTLMNLVIEDPNAKVRRGQIISEHEVPIYIKHPLAMIGIDTFALDFKWEVKYPPYYLPHPNTYNAYPRFFRKYVKEMGVLSLEEAVMKVTSMPAKKLGLKDRGIIRKGAWADIVLMNFEKLSDSEDYIEPRKPPRGIEYVLVNGEIVVDKGEHTGKRAGKVLKHEH